MRNEMSDIKLEKINSLTKTKLQIQNGMPRNNSEKHCGNVNMKSEMKNRKSGMKFEF